MTNYNATNERMKRQYFAYLAEAQGHSEQTIDAVAKAIPGSRPILAAKTSSRFISSRRKPLSAIWRTSVRTEAGSR